MTAEAPLHLERSVLVHQRHLVDGAVAGIASHSLGDVNAVIEKDEVRKLVDARPLQRFAGPVAGAHGLEQLGIGPDLRMAVHAGLGGRNTGEARCLHGSVTVTAIDAKAGDMMLMAERHRLGLANAGVGDVRRALDRVRDPSQCGNDENCAKNSGAGQRVRAAMKDLRHFSYEIWLEETRRSIFSILARLLVRQFWLRVETTHMASSHLRNWKL